MARTVFCQHPGWVSSSDSDTAVIREIAGAHGKYISAVDRLLTISNSKATDTPVEMAETLVEALRERSGDAWEDVRWKVRAFTPDGAADE